MLRVESDQYYFTTAISLITIDSFDEILLATGSLEERTLISCNHKYSKNWEKLGGVFGAGLTCIIYYAAMFTFVCNSSKDD